MTAFRFQPGSDARYKKTVLCKVCSDIKNACQCCINDLTYNIPLKVRDRILAKHQTVDEIQVPQSEAGLQVFAQEAEKRREQGLATGRLSHISPAAHAELQRNMRRQPNYSRNKAKYCYHFMKGTCTRGAECSYRHEFPDDWETNKEFYTKDVTKSIKDRFFGTNDAVAKKWIDRMEEKEEQQRLAASSASTTLVVLGVDSTAVTSDDLKDALFSFGEITRVQVVPAKRIAFVEFATKAEAQEAMLTTHGKLVIDGQRLRLSWATASKGSGEEGLLGAVPGSAGSTRDDALAVAAGPSGAPGALPLPLRGWAPPAAASSSAWSAAPSAGFPAAAAALSAFPPPAGMPAAMAPAYAGYGYAGYGHSAYGHAGYGHAQGAISMQALPAPAGSAGAGRGRGRASAAPYASMHTQRYGAAVAATKEPGGDAGAAAATGDDAGGAATMAET